MELTGVLMRHLKKGMIVIIYLDDLIIRKSRNQSEKDTQMVLDLLIRLGFLINYDN